MKIDKLVAIIGGIVIILLIIWAQKIRPVPPAIVDTDFKPVDSYIDKEGKTHATVPTTEVSPQVMKAIVDSITRTIKGEVKVITQVVQVVDTVFREVPVEYKDDGFYIKKEDPYLSLEVQGKDDKATISFQMRDTLTYALTETKRFLRSNTLQADISNKSPYYQTLEGRSFTITQSKTLIAIGPYVGYGYNIKGGSFSPTVGVAITFPLINIKANGR